MKMQFDKSSFFQIIKRKEILLYIVLFIASLSLIGWLEGKIIYASVFLRFIPIAPSTALIFFILSILLISNYNFEESRITQSVTSPVVFLVTLFCLLVFLEYIFNFTWDIENIFIANPEKFENVSTGRMSPITSLLFFFTCIGILAGMKHTSNTIKNIGNSFSLLTCFIATVLFIGYLYKAPLLYGSQIIPVALPTAICFLLFSVTLLRISELKFWTFNLFGKNPIEFLLLKTFLPLVVFVVVLQGFLDTNFSINHNNPTLTSAIVILIFLAITIFIVIRASAFLGNTLMSAENKLRESEELSRYLLQTIPFGIDIVDENGIVLFQSENMKKLWGDEAIGNKCRKLYRDDETRCAGCPLKDGIKIGTTEVYESPVVLGDKIFEIIHTGMIFEGKKAILEIFIDISERKQVETLLQQSENKYRTIVENIGEGIGFINPEGQFVLANKATEEIFGVSSGGLLGMNLDQFLSAEQKKLINKETYQRVPGNKSVYEIEIIRTDGEKRVIIVTIVPQFGKDEGFVGTYGVFRDITERILAEDNLRKDQERHKSILRTAMDGFFITDLQGHMLEVNEAFCRMSGYSKTELLTMSILDIEDMEVADETNAHTQKIIVKGEDHFESRYRRKDGSVFEVENSAQYQPDEGGRFVVFFKDISERKQTASELLKHENQYRLLIETANEGILVAQGTNLMFVNPMIQKISGYTEEELLQISFMELVHYDDRELVMNNSRKRIKGETADSRYQFRILKKDKSIKWVEINGIKIEWEGNPATLNFITDITDRKQVEVALKESEALYRDLVLKLPDGVYKSTYDGKFVEVNPALVTMLGYGSREELLAVDINTQLYFEPEDCERTVLQETMLEKGVFRLRKKDGSEIWVEDHGWHHSDENGNILSHQGVMRDITERRQREEELKKSESSLRNAQKIAKMGSWEWDLATQKTNWSDNYFNIFGFEPAGVNPSFELFRKRIHPDDIHFLDESHAIIMKDKIPNIFELRIIHKDGTVKWIQNNISPVIKDDKLIKLSGTFFDITDRKQVEEEIKLKNEELQKINAEKDKFFSIIAHDLRSPFNLFLGFTRMMVEELPSLKPDEIQKIALTMRNSALNLYRLLENLLAWATIKQGIIPFTPEILPLLPVVEESITTMIGPINNKGIELTVDIPVGSEVYADSNILHTVLRNLISNALKFTHKGGRIHVSAKINGDKSVEISIKDSGIGMKSTMMDSLFKLDAQSGRKGTEGEPSTGLGLILCKEFIEKHGGKIRVESEEGKGSVFSFTLPHQLNPQGFKNLEGLGRKPRQGRSLKRSSRVSPEVDGEEKQINSVDSGLKILIAEDDENSGILLNMAVKTLNKEIINVKNGVEAVEVCRNNPGIFLILMDVQMPEMNGYEATRQIRQFNTSVIIIAQTAYELSGEREKAIEAGCNDYIAKPVRKADLLVLLKKYL